MKSLETRLEALEAQQAPADSGPDVIEIVPMLRAGEVSDVKPVVIWRRKDAARKVANDGNDKSAD